MSFPTLDIISLSAWSFGLPQTYAIRAILKDRQGSGGLLLALPIIISVLLVNAGLGVITRSAPALNIISVGFPAIMIAGIIILILVLPGMVLRIDSFWRDGFSMLVNLFERL